MARRGRCRCGTVLGFEEGPDGFKMRCPTCGAVVRLRADTPNAATGPRQRKRSGVLAFRPPAPSDPEAPCEDRPPIDPDDYNYDALRPGELPVVELVPLADLSPPTCDTSGRGWWLPLTALVVVGAATFLVILMLRG